MTQHESNYQREKRLLFEFLQNTPSTTSSGGSSPAGSGGGSSGGSSSGGSSVAIPASLGNVIPSNKYVATNQGKTRLKNALTYQLNYFFSNPGPSYYIKDIGDRDNTPRPSSAISGYCAGYAYNIIKDLKEAWENNGVIEKGWQSGGHAWQNPHLTNINNTGLYDMYYIGYKLASEWKKWVNNQSWNYGDVLNYRLINGVGDLGYHTQVYTGDIYRSVTTSYWDTNQRRTETTNSGWTTSNKKNYGTGFVYNDKRYGNGMYHMYAFKVKEEFLKG